MSDTITVRMTGAEFDLLRQTINQMQLDSAPRQARRGLQDLLAGIVRRTDDAHAQMQAAAFAALRRNANTPALSSLNSKEPLTWPAALAAEAACDDPYWRGLSGGSGANL